LPSSWPESAEELERLQIRVAAEAARTPLWTPSNEPKVGAVFAATRRGLAGTGEPGDPAWVAAVVMRDGEVLGWAVVRGRFPAPYQPGLLALREGALLERAVRALEPPPDVLIVNATGADHPRSAGLAVHLGWALELPSIGVTDRLLASGAGAVRLGPGRGIWVHPAWRTDAGTARSIVEPLLDKRTPAPLREARRLARTARANDAAGY
jgi:deoxyribonuclease V